LDKPTLVQTGDGDLVVDPRNSDLLVEAIPDARLSVYEGAGHVFMWQEPERFVAELEEFLC
jgi:pimeloyl-ACP methyl ester carboxylesterase